MRAIASLRRRAGGFCRCVAVVGLLAAVACTPASELTFDGEPAQLRSIPYLKSRCTASSAVIREEIAIRGIVTGNDLYGEFDREIVIEDAEGGLAIAIDRADLAGLFPLDCEVTVSCNSLTLCEYGGRISLGTSPTEYGAGRIPAQETARFLRRSASPGQTVRPRTLAFGEVDARLIDTYVQFAEVRFTQPGTWCAVDPLTGHTVTTEHTIVDAQGATFIVRVPATCTYAKEHLPEGKCSLYGIIGCFNGKYSLRVVRHKALPV